MLYKLKKPSLIAIKNANVFTSLFAMGIQYKYKLKTADI